MKTIFRLSTFSLLATLLLTSCNKSTNSNKNSTNHSNQNITLNITTEPQTLDPRKSRALSDGILIRMFMEGLTRTDKNGKASLAIAQKIDVSSDLMTYTFHLKDSHWSNGDPITSQDFAYAWKKTLSPSFNSPNASMLYVIKNAKEAKKGTLPLSLVGIETPDTKTLVIQLNHPIPYFLDLITHPIFFPINPSIDKVNPHWAENQSTYVGNGPFNLCEWKHNDIIIAKKNNSYWDEHSVHLNDLKMIMVSEITGLNMFEKNKLEWEGSPLSTVPLDAIQSLKEKKQIQISPVLGTQWIRVNTEKPPFNSIKIRKAFAYAIHRKMIIDHITQGDEIPATGIVPQVMGLQSKPLFSDGDTTTAQTLFNEALKEMELSAETFPEITLMYSCGDRNHLMAEAIQEQWRNAFNIKVTLEPIESKIFFSRISNNDFTLSLGNWFADFNDPINFLEVFKSKDTGTNNTNWENLNYTELLETSNYCQCPEERKSILQQSEEIIIQQMPVIPLFHFTMLYTQDEMLKDVVLTNMGNIDFKYAHIEKE